MNWSEHIRRVALRCAVSTTLDQIEDILVELVDDVILDDAAIVRKRGLNACATTLEDRIL